MTGITWFQPKDVVTKLPNCSRILYTVVPPFDNSTPPQKNARKIGCFKNGALKTQQPPSIQLPELIPTRTKVNISEKWSSFPTHTPWKFKIAPENGWLEDEFPFGKAYFQGRAVKLRGVVEIKLQLQHPIFFPKPSPLGWANPEFVSYPHQAQPSLKTWKCHAFGKVIYQEGEITKNILRQEQCWLKCVVAYTSHMSHMKSDN